MIDFKALSKNIRRRNWKPFLLKIYRPIFRRKDHEGVDILEEEWDNLIILDACRYDIFKEENFLEGDLEKRVSKGSSSSEWLAENFPEDEYENIVYVSANPHLCPFELDYIGDAMDSSKFHDFAPVYLEEPEEDIKSANYMSVHPGTVNEFAREFAEKYPLKKLIVHYMQPHIPYIGETKIRLDQEVENPFELFQHPKCREGYRDNLRLVLEHVRELIPHLSGQTVVSADHGELFDERGLYGHPTGIYFSDLVTVPWFEVDGNYLDNEETRGIDI
ncbi:MAG: hypothetical protein BRC29_00765 [Nanohaloarchaea archaeon SW_7_43_1]|nr:MAG: hypothetical protein BRC29_00765 [Nanohaloarchaea archaeon SW_7_43_1]